MDIKYEIIAGTVADVINAVIKHIDADAVIDSVAITALNEIRNVIQNEELEDDFDVVEEIVCIFNKYNISTGSRHDF